MQQPRLFLPCLAHLFSLLSRSLTGAKINPPRVSMQSSFSCVARASAHTHVFRVSPYTRNSLSGYFPKHSFGFFFFLRRILVPFITKFPPLYTQQCTCIYVQSLEFRNYFAFYFLIILHVLFPIY